MSDFATIERWLQVELDRMWLLVERRFEVVEAPLVVQAALAARAQRRTASLSDALVACERELARLRRAAPIGAFARRLGLRALDVDVLVAAFAPLVDPALAELYRMLRWGAARTGTVDLAMIGELLELGRGMRVALLDTLDADRPLVRWGIVTVGAPEALTVHRPLRVASEIVAALCGAPRLPPALAPHARIVRARGDLDGLEVPAATRAAVQPLLDGAAADAPLPWLVLWGPRGSGRRELAARLAGASGRDALIVDAGGPEALALAQREALLRDAVLVVGPITGTPPALRGFPGRVAFVVTASAPPRVATERPVHEIELAPLPAHEAARLWARVAPGLDATAIAGGFTLTPGDIRDAAAAATAHAAAERRATTVADLRRGIEQCLRAELADVVERAPAHDAWDDIVLPAADLERLREFIGRKRHAATIYERWGLARRIRYGRGMIALFSGPPGTGKTMLAGVIAHELGLELYRVDLSQIVSKWQGETEKQLARVFDIAERTQAVLLFDEADALFGKRGDVENARDRFANLTVNYLLQRLESYPGVAVLTTNKEAALDEALQRRLGLHLRLDVPEEPERLRLWRSFLVPELPGAARIDVAWLAQRFELTGGTIKNAAVRAAFLAADAGRALDDAIVVTAVERELEDMGRVVQAAMIRRRAS